MEYFLLIIFVFAAGFVHGVSVSKSVSDQRFYFHEFSTHPSLMARVVYKITTLENSPLFDIYTGDSQPSVEKKCSSRIFGQLANSDLHRNLSRGQNGCRYILNSSKILECTGEIEILDYMPRSYSFSLGFLCGTSGSLTNVTLVVALVDQKNRTECIPNTNRFCSALYPHILLPSLMGDTSIKSADERFSSSFLYLFSTAEEEGVSCYQHALSTRCYLFLPRCDSKNSTIVPLCLEACEEAIQACSNVVDVHLTRKFYNKLSEMFNCSYLPSNKNENVPCFYKKVTCGPPPEVPGAQMVLTTPDQVGNNLSAENYSLHSEVSVSCMETFVKTGNDTMRCEYSGSWSQPPKCVQKPCGPPPEVPGAQLFLTIPADEIGNNLSAENYSLHSEVFVSCMETLETIGNNTMRCEHSGSWSQPPNCVQKQRSTRLLMKILLPCAATLLVVLIIFAAVKYKTRERKKGSKRNKSFDAFVCYAYHEPDLHFAENTIRVTLEENHNPPFKLCIHRRDFIPGRDIMWSIRNAIRNSNSAIIVMSQEYINSLWCKEEFEQCYVEHMKDPAFKLFVILMQAKDSLENTCDYMESFFEKKTYLEFNDPRKFEKIARDLRQVKGQRNSDNTCT